MLNLYTWCSYLFWTFNMTSWCWTKTFVILIKYLFLLKFQYSKVHNLIEKSNENFQLTNIDQFFWICSPNQNMFSIFWKTKERSKSVCEFAWSSILVVLPSQYSKELTSTIVFLEIFFRGRSCFSLKTINYNS